MGLSQRPKGRRGYQRLCDDSTKTSPFQSATSGGGSVTMINNCVTLFMDHP